MKELLNKQKTIKNLLNEWVDEGIAPGLTYGVIYNNKEFVGNVGNKSLFNEKMELSIELNSYDTLYDVASLTKVLCIVPIILRLIDRGKINFDDKVIKFLPNYKHQDITIYDLLTHSSGLPPEIEERYKMSYEEIRKKILSSKKAYETGTDVVYSCIGYITLGFIIEKIYGKSLSIVAKEEVFEPLGMNDTCFNPIDISRCAPVELTKDRGLVKGKVHDESANFLNGIAGNAGIFSTAEDINKFMKMMLNEGRHNGKQYISKEFIDMCFKKLIFEKNKNRDRSLCWIVGNNDEVIKDINEDIISFSGFTGTSISIDRGNKVAIALLSNRVHPTRDNNLLAKYRPCMHKKIYSVLEKDARKEG